MKHRARICYTEAQKSIMWDRWQKGDSLHEIARIFDRGHSSIARILSLTGGIRPAERVRSGMALSLAEREEISRGIACHESFRSIAYRLRRAPSTISREVKRNEGDEPYRATQADQAAWDRARRPKPCKLAGNIPLIQTITDKLQSYWSPEQISGWLKRAYPTEAHNQVSHETLYQRVFDALASTPRRQILAYLSEAQLNRRGDCR